MSLLARLGAYVANNDPRAAAGNTVALVVAANQPFYPLYIYFAISPEIWPSLLTFLSTPFFLAVPAIARRWPRLGRAMLPLTGIANAAIANKAFGVASGVDLFLLPCLLLGALLFRPTERLWTVLITLLAAGSYLLLRQYYGPPLHAYSVEEFNAFVKLNAMSVATLTLFIGLLFGGLPADPPSQRRDEVSRAATR